jgi:hypothetical protein
MDACNAKMIRSALGLSLLLLGGCGNAPAAADIGSAGAGGSGGDSEVLYPETLPYARSVESFTPGEGAGFGESSLPDVVLGPPRGMGERSGSLHVLSLGVGGEIVLGFGERTIVDEPGPDFVVFENAFWPGGVRSMVYAELGEVSVSEDGETWLTFPCDSEGDGEGGFSGCAGASPTLEFDPLALVPLDLANSGGDAFDLADLELPSARFVKIIDLGTLEPAGTSSGFELDAVGLAHKE